MAETTIEKPREAAFGWRPYQIYLVALLLLITVSNYLDRGILSVVQEPMKAELGLTDWQLGLLGGPAFALFYSLAGIPVARFAERVNRAGLLAACVAVWSTMTALCGAAGNFVQIALARLGVGAGEGGCIPISHSLLADSFTLRQRGVVMSLISAGPALASLLMPIAGGMVAQHYGWRVAFMAVGLPGLALAVLAWFTIRDPRAGKARAAEQPKRSFFADFGWLMKNPAFVMLFLSGAFIGMANNGVALFEMSYMIRSHGLSLTEASGVRSLTGLAGLAGIFLGGVFADRFADSRGRSYVLVPAVGAFLSFVVYFTAFTVEATAVVIPLLVLGGLCYNIKGGPMYAAVQNIVPGHMRATAAAVFMLAATVLGSTLGAPLAGGVSDFVAAREFAQFGVFEAMCPGGKAVAGSAFEIAGACSSASADGLRMGMRVISFAFVVGTILLLVSARTIRINQPDEGVEVSPR